MSLFQAHHLPPLARDAAVYLCSASGVWFGVDFAVAAPTLFDGVASVLAQLSGLLLAGASFSVALTALLSKLPEIRKTVAVNAEGVAALKREVEGLTKQNGRQQESLDAMADRNSQLRGRLEAYERRPELDPAVAALAAARVASAAETAASRVSAAVESALDRRDEHKPRRSPEGA